VNAKRLAHRAHRLANRALEPARLSVDTTSRRRLSEELRRRVVWELHECFRLAVFPDLQPRERRVELLARLLGTKTSEAIYLVYHLQLALSGAGDVCEFGVAQGATSAVLANEIRDTDRSLWLFDSFEGLSRPTPEDVLLDDIGGLGSMDAYAGEMAYGPERVRDRLAEIGFPRERTRIVKGYLDEVETARHVPREVAFAYLDMDLYEPTRIALALLRDRLTEHARVVVDDFGFLSAGPKSAVEEFLANDPGEFELELPLEFAGHFCLLRRARER